MIIDFYFSFVLYIYEESGTASREIQNQNPGPEIQNLNQGDPEIQDANLGPQSGDPNSVLYSPIPDPDPYPNPFPAPEPDPSPFSDQLPDLRI